MNEKEEFEERAAIMEYDGGLSREEAEYHANRLIQEKRFRNMYAKSQGDDCGNEGSNMAAKPKKKVNGKKAKK